jgi:hypothetical protein
VGDDATFESPIGECQALWQILLGKHHRGYRNLAHVNTTLFEIGVVLWQSTSVGQDILDSNFLGVTTVRKNEIISDQAGYRCIPLNIGIFLVVINQKRYRCRCEGFRHACAIEKCFGRDWNIGISRKPVPLFNLSTFHHEASLTCFCAYCGILSYSDT